MVDSTDAMLGNYVNADMVKHLKAKKLVVVTEGEYVDTKFGRKLQLDVEVDGKAKTWKPNIDSLKNFNNSFGPDTKGWIGKIANLQVVSFQGKETVLATPQETIMENTVSIQEDDDGILPE